ncbi:hypothetical protein KOR42_18620 [Thalassoglobus neptunius]|uniref:Glutamine amidotransferase domain-containing protein n=1 Tax=Thalassoglobus neptunius TaxID=1938619 RepID=A0A5C5X5U9_9PLAN|nr:hypothetical protein [Thalassoglobus neptunius]TWT58487.1 hypothetical protein KOR42_18620 [Thalassoglobus neptunius]
MIIAILTIGTIVLGNPQWLWPIVAGGLFVAVGMILSYRSARLPALTWAALVALKLVGLALICFCLLNPLWSESDVRPGENIVLLMVDNSSSLSIRDPNQKPRGDVVEELLHADHKDWFTRLSQDYDLRRYLFGDQLRQVEDFQDVDFSDNRSELATSLQGLQQRFQNKPLAGVLLFSDGNATDLEAFDGLETSVPIYPVVSPDWEDLGDDLAIERLAVRETNFEDAPISVVASVTSSYSSEQTVVATLELVKNIGHSADEEHESVQAERDSSTNFPGTELSDSIESVPTDEEEADGKSSSSISQSVSLLPGVPTTLEFDVLPPQLGICYYRLRIRPAAEEDIFTDPETSSEATLENNERLLTVDRGSSQKRILYVGGRPNWEYKFLNRALSEDRAVDLVTLIRIAKKEAKFDFRGRVGEDSNSLFRGFKDEVDEETESFDEAVLVRLNTRDAGELAGGFPKTKEELYEYKAIILDDVEAGFFSHDQQALIDRFVSVRGGGLLLLGGRDAFRHGDWDRSSLRDAFPVYLDRQGPPASGELRWDLTRDGWLEPWMRVRSTEDQEKMRLQHIPELAFVNPATDPKPGGRIFATVQDSSSNEYPAVVAQQYGQGRSVAVLIGDLWKWSLSRPETDEDDLARFWRQLVRWLIADVPQRVEVSLSPISLGTIPAINIQVNVRQADYEPQENAKVTVKVTTPSEEVLELTAEPSLEAPGLFETSYVLRERGAYLASVITQNEESELPITAQAGWTSDPKEEEFRNVGFNRPLLDRLAEDSGGEVIEIGALDEFVRTLPQKDLPAKQVRTTPLWHTPWLLVAAILCLTAEWGLRRVRGLP